MEKRFRGEAGEAVGTVKRLLSTPEASVFLFWTKCLFLFSPSFLPGPGRFSAVHACRALG